MKTIDSPLEVKDVSRTGRIEGFASVFGHVDLVGDRVERGAFSKFLESTAPGSASWPKMLWSHSPDEPIGVWSRIYETSTGLRVEGELLKDVQRGREALALLRARAIQGLSIGFRLHKWRLDTGGKKPVRVLEEVELREVSIVAFPAETHARVLVAKGDGVDVDPNIERAATDFAAFVLDDLDLRPPVVLRFERQVDHLGAAGEFDPRSPDTICLRSDLSRRQMLLTAGHEVMHMAQSRRGAFGLQRKAIDLSTSERRELEDEAETFAVLALERFESGLDKLTAALRDAAKSVRSRRIESVSAPPKRSTTTADRPPPGKMEMLYTAGW